MAETLVLEAQPRTLTGKKVNALRAQGLVPGIIYGPKLETPIPFQVPARRLQNSLKAAGGTQLIELTVGDEKHSVLVRDVQRDYIRGDLLHIDFYAVALGELFKTEVPVSIIGESELVRSGEAVLITELTSVEVECLPSQIPSELTVDMSKIIEIGDALTVADLIVPEEVAVLTDPSELLARSDYAVALPPAEEEEEEKVFESEFDADGVEVIERGKREEEDY